MGVLPFHNPFPLRVGRICHLPVAIRIWQMERNFADVINSVCFELIKRIVLGEPDWIGWKPLKVTWALSGVRGAAGWLYEASSGMDWAHTAKCCEWPCHRLSACASLTQRHVKCWCPVWWYLEVGLWMIIGHEDEALRNGNSVLIKEDLLPLCHVPQEEDQTS